MFKLDEMQRIGQINREDFYDYETNSYLHKFNSPEALTAMKKIHSDYFDDVVKKGNKPSAFY
jgi:hypothetical protein